MGLPEPLKWQKEAITRFQQYLNGIVVAGTGAGKTIFCMHLMKKNRMSTIIIVPTIVLMKQWKSEILEGLDVPEDAVGLYYGGKKDLKPITIAVINSVREEDLSMFDMVICDETHRYGSLENIKPLKKSNFKVKLGVTATLEREDGGHKDLIEYIGPVRYTYSPENALEDGVLNRFDLINVGTQLTPEEQKVYDKYDIEAKEIMREFGGFPQMAKAVSRNRRAGAGMKAITMRRMTYCNAEKKAEMVEKLVERHKDDKIIIFNEFIQMAEAITKRLSLKYKVGVFHSGSKDLSVIEQFSRGAINVLVAVKSLNEGLNVKTANVGIMVSANSVKRNTIQRLGRVIRKVEGKEAYFYQIYCRGTKEFNDVNKRTEMIKACADKVMWE